MNIFPLFAVILYLFLSYLIFTLRLEQSKGSCCIYDRCERAQKEMQEGIMYIRPKNLFESKIEFFFFRFNSNNRERIVCKMVAIEFLLP